MEPDPRFKAMGELFISLVLAERCAARRYPRAVKIEMSNFPRKWPSNAYPNGIGSKVWS
jgi:hypothetical protein